MEDFKLLLQLYGPERTWMLTDENVNRLVVPRLEAELKLPATDHRIIIGAGEAHKSPATAEKVWTRLLSGGATRAHLLLNVGGGMVSDLGGFCAATFMRGMAYANVATTLLGAADACIGGKTGIDFLGIKNAIGAFAMPLNTELYAPALDTLPRAELLSGMGEMLKTALLGAPELLRQIFDREADLLADRRVLAKMASAAGRFKMEVVASDPREQGLRKILNLGHTFGHAFESLALSKGHPLPHGVCVAHGLVTALVVSHIKRDFPTDVLYAVAGRIVKPYYKAPLFTCDDYAELLRLMHADKKNAIHGQIRAVVLRNVGKPEWDVEVADTDVETALDITRDLLGA